MRFRPMIALVPLALMVLAAGPAVAADTTPPSYPIMPNQYFDGVVNGKTAGAIVYTVCPGPYNGSGHPAAGQTLSVAPASPSGTTTVGFTGSSGNSVVASPVANSTSGGVLFIEYFRTSALPTTWTVPCNGEGTIAFTPRPAGYNGRADLVAVRFVNIAVTP